MSRIGCNKYTVNFIDDYSRFTWFYFRRPKSEVLDTLKKFYTYKLGLINPSKPSAQIQGRIHFVGILFISDSKVHQKFCPHTPQQNDIAERKNLHIMETNRALVLESKVPRTFWCEAAHTAIHLINRLPTGVLDNIFPFECLHGHPPTYLFMYIRAICTLNGPWPMIHN